MPTSSPPWKAGLAPIVDTIAPGHGRIIRALRGHDPLPVWGRLAR